MPTSEVTPPLYILIEYDVIGILFIAYTVVVIFGLFRRKKWGREAAKLWNMLVFLFSSGVKKLASIIVFIFVNDASGGIPTLWNIGNDLVPTIIVALLSVAFFVALSTKSISMQFGQGNTNTNV